MNDNRENKKYVDVSLSSDEVEKIVTHARDVTAMLSHEFGDAFFIRLFIAVITDAIDHVPGVPLVVVNRMWGELKRRNFEPPEDGKVMIVEDDGFNITIEEKDDK